MKNSKLIKLPAPAELVKALELVPFHAGPAVLSVLVLEWQWKPRAAVRDVTRTLAAVLKGSLAPTHIASGTR